MNLEEFNRRLEENNANLIAVSDYMGRNNKIYVKCKKCNNLMGHKTPFTWLYGSSNCYYCDNLPFSEAVETYKSYVERKTCGRVSPLSDYKGSSIYIEYRCNLHNIVFAQSHSELFRKDGQGGVLCVKCKGEIRKKKYTSEELNTIAKMYAPNLIFKDDFKTKSGKVNYRCSICENTGKTSVTILERAKKGTIYCSKCNNRRKKTKEEFTEELKTHNPNLIAVSEYIEANEKICVKCENCGNSMNHKTPHEWLKNYKCYYCDNQAFNQNVENYGDYMLRNYGENYSFKSDKWHGSKTKHLFYCNLHNEEFWQTPDTFKPEKAQCSKCAAIRKTKWVKERTKEHDQYVAELGKVSPEIEILGKYKKNTDPIAVRCRNCLHEWAPTAGPLLHQRTKCPKCSGALLTAEDFKKRVMNNSPSVKIVGKFYRGKDSIMVRCKKCNLEWEAKKDVLIRGCGCKMCHCTGTSRQELMIYYTVKELFPELEVLWRDRNYINKELDIVIPDKKIAIEPGHFAWHKDKLDLDLSKEMDCEKLGIKLFTCYFSCQNAEIPIPFKRLMCVDDEPKTAYEIIALTMKVIEWIAKEENWGDEYKHINYERIWKLINNIKIGNATNSDTENGSEENNVSKKKNKPKYDRDSFRNAVTNIRDDCNLIDDFEDSKTKLRVECKLCKKISNPMLPREILNGKKLECNGFHKFETNMETLHKTIKYCPDDYHKDSTDIRFNHIACECLVCGKKWKPTVDSLNSGHGCPNYRDARHSVGKKRCKTDSWKNGSNTQVRRDDGVLYKSIIAAVKGEGVSRGKMNAAIKDGERLNNHFFTLVVRDKRIRRKSTLEIFESIEDAVCKTGFGKDYIYKQIREEKDFEWVVRRD